MRLGADPEVFLQDVTGKHISAIGLIGANKWKPLQIVDLPNGFTLQEDNVTLEYGIPPATSAEEFVSHIQTVMNRSRDWIGNLTFSKLSCTVFDKDQMEHPLAHVFGCEPDFDAWTGKTNKMPPPSHEFMRSAGGHIHVETDQNPADVTRRMDLFLGVPSTKMDKLGAPRRTMYGKRGAHRVKSYGVEYRVLSNFWIMDPALIRWAWNATSRALNSKMDVSELDMYIEMAINQNDEAMADALISEFNLDVVNV